MPAIERTTAGKNFLVTEQLEASRDRWGPENGSPRARSQKTGGHRGGFYEWEQRQPSLPASLLADDFVEIL